VNDPGTSKFLSLILRHKPEIIGLRLDQHGWADVEELIAKSALHDRLFSKEGLQEIVRTNDKQRFAFNEDETKIRASQGHSLEVELGLTPLAPPEYLYHGTIAKFIDNIRIDGLKKMSRQHVHLSMDRETAEKVGSRHGKAVILHIQSEKMHADGFSFYLSQNGVWLTDHVPVKYIDL